MSKKGTLFWITGLSSSGKTTIGTQLYYKLKRTNPATIILDGDILKKIVGNDLGYSKADRYTRAQRYCQLCKNLTSQGIDVIICTIAMIEDIRKWNRKNIRNYLEIFLDVEIEILKTRDKKGLYSNLEENVIGVDLSVEFPKEPDLIINNNGQYTINECVNMIESLYTSKSIDTDINYSDYWNSIYSNLKNIEKESPFATFIYNDYLSSNAEKTLIELGCGSGRDSMFFAKNKINVTAVDISKIAVDKLNKRKAPNLKAFCDDFSAPLALYERMYDYCYSRFTIHSINSLQETNTIKNAYHTLKNDGLFFIEVRSINDSIFGLGEKISHNEYIYNNHYRRFIDIDELKEKLKCFGFKIIFELEDINLAPYKDENPSIIRIIAQK